MRLEPVEIITQERGEVVEFEWESAEFARVGREFQQRFGREEVSLEFAQGEAELPGEAGQPGAGAEQFQFFATPRQQRAQNHQPAFLVEHPGRRLTELLEDKTSEPLEGKNAQPRVALKRIVRKQLAFELKGGLLGREQNQRRAVRHLCQRGADLGQTAMRLAAAGGAEEEVDLHAGFFHVKPGGGKGFISSRGWRVWTPEPVGNIQHSTFNERRILAPLDVER